MLSAEAEAAVFSTGQGIWAQFLALFFEAIFLFSFGKAWPKTKLGCFSCQQADRDDDDDDDDDNGGGGDGGGGGGGGGSGGQFAALVRGFGSFGLLLALRADG